MSNNGGMKILLIDYDEYDGFIQIEDYYYYYYRGFLYCAVTILNNKKAQSALHILKDTKKNKTKYITS